MNVISKRRVLHISGTMNIGGTETMIMNLYRKLYDKYTFDFVYYSQENGYYDQEIKELGGKIIKISDTNGIGEFKVIRELYQVIRNGQYDIVHAHTLYNCGIAMLAAKLAGAKIRISHAHTNLNIENSSIKKIYCSFMRYLINNQSTNLLACSNSAGKYLFGEQIVNKKNYCVLPNYVDYKRYLDCDDYNSIREELGIKSNDIVIGHIGRFVNAKNHDFLISVINNMINKNNLVKAILVGDGPLRKEIERYVNDLGIQNNVYFLGLRTDTERILNNCDLFIFPSIYEGLGLVMLEAQACGLPCLVSEAIQPEADLNVGLVNKITLKKGAEEWSNQALKLIKDKNKDSITIKKAFCDRGYNLEKIVNKLLKIYKI